MSRATLYVSPHPPSPLLLSQAYSPAPQFAPQFVHIPQSKAKKGLIGISRRVSKSLFCFAVFFGPTPLPGGCPGVAGQVFQFFGLIAGSEYKEHRKKSTALPGYQIGSCNPSSVSLSVPVHMACIGCLPVRQLLQLPSLSLLCLGLNPHCLRPCGCLFEHVSSESLCAENSFVFGNPLLMNSTFSCLSAVAPRSNPLAPLPLPFL